MRGRFIYLAAMVVAVAGVLLLAGPAGASRQVHATAATNVHCGDTINTSVTMNGDLDCSAYNGTALTITSPGVTLDLGGHTLTVNVNQDGVYSDEVNNWTVQNGTITSGSEQVYPYYSDNVTIQNLTMTNSTDDCIDTEYAGGVLITNNTCSGAADYGLYSEYAGGITVIGNVFTNDVYPVYLDYGDNGDVFSSNYFKGNSEYPYDYESSYNSWTGNISTANSYGYYIEPDDYGTVNLVNNAARNSANYGFYVYENYNDYYYGSPAAAISGNTSTYSASYGFYDYYSPGAIWTNNTASRNGGDGFYLEENPGEQFKSNTAKYNNGDGFYFEDDYAPYSPMAISGNSAWYNTGYGFDSGYGLNGSGNTGSNTNTSGDCLGLGGCT